MQTLFYGIFSAWVLWRHAPEHKVPQPHFNWKPADDYLKVPVLRKLFREVSPMKLSVQTCENPAEQVLLLCRVFPGWKFR